jgi:hypothetical protein
MGQHDTSRSGELRVLAERLRRRAREMSLPHYIEMMEHAARELDAEARSLEEDETRPTRLGCRRDISI